MVAASEPAVPSQVRAVLHLGHARDCLRPVEVMEGQKLGTLDCHGDVRGYYLHVVPVQGCLTFLARLAREPGSL